ncbi:unnamed protein product [Orchesella dallaii]
MQAPNAAKKRPSLGTIPPSAQTRNSFVDKGRWAKTKGTKPVQDPTTVGEIFTKVLVHFCRKVLFVEAKYRLTAYAILLFFASLVTDYMPFPKTYFAYSDNFPNQYFVKFSWGWTFLVTGAFMYLTTAVYCCGNRQQILRHFVRLAIGTLVWFTWTNLFSMIETSTGQCLTKEAALYSVKSRRNCLGKGGKWTSFDISGHAFLLIWCIFFITEEARAIIGWDNIKDFIRHEEHNRGSALRVGSISTDTFEETPLKGLTDGEFEELKQNYGKHDVIAKIVLVGMTFLTLLWDLMIIATALYFHVMIEKVIAGLIAAVMWFAIYRGFYTLEVSPGLPGSGLFKYSDVKPAAVAATPKPSTSLGKGSSTAKVNKPASLPDDVPKFMGMPLYALRKRKDELEMDDLDSPTK